MAQYLEPPGLHARFKAGIASDVNDPPGSDAGKHPGIGEADKFARRVLPDRLSERVVITEDRRKNHRLHKVLDCVS